MKFIRILVSVNLILLLSLPAFASRKGEVTMVIVPREDDIVKVGMEIAERYPTLLLSYKSSGSNVSLHGWTGSEWVNVSLEDYKAGNFFKTGPDSALVIEGDSGVIPSAIMPPEEWCPSAYAITTTDLRPLLHLVGQYFDFKYKEWKSIANEYGFTMDEVNPEGLNIAWYHKRLTENLKTREAIALADLKHWKVIHVPQPSAPVEEEPVIVQQEEPVTEVAVAAEEVLVDNPLTNDAPEAVVLGAGDAEEASVETSTTNSPAVFSE